MPEDPQESQEEQERPRPRVVDRRVSARAAEPSSRAAPSPHPSPEPSPSAAPPGPEPAPQPTAAPPPSEPRAPGPSDEQVWTPEQEEAAQAIAREMADRPAEDWVLSAAINLANVGGTKLQVGDLEGARLAIDGLAALVEAVGSRLAEVEAPLRQTLAQLQMAFAQAAAPPPSGPSA